jgi:phenylpropionate dioxygenase-like ring-hydroxylating dioxygenase large terminal subunit
MSSGTNAADAPVRVGRYVRDLGANLARMIENALDWEHLPHVHSSSFGSIRLIGEDAGGWRADATLPGDDQALTLDLRLDDDRSGWVTTTTRGGRTLSEIRTRAEALGDRSCRVTVDFLVPGVPADRRAAVGAAYERLYATLYDEDEAMMIARQTAIDSRAAISGGWRTVRLGDGEHRVPNACPHLALPLDGEPDAAGIITCPWHGYRFDVRTGRCVSGQRCGWS